MRNVVFVVLAVLMMSACDTADCTLYNKVTMGMTFWDGTGEKMMIKSFYSITTAGIDSVLVNKDRNRQGVDLPLSYWAELDSFFLHVWMEDDVATVDTIVVEKSNRPHFESPDCPTRMFHDILGIRHSKQMLDSVRVVKSAVEFGQLENVRLYFR